MSKSRKRAVTVTVDADLLDYAESRADNVSAYVNEALADRVHRERRLRALWQSKVAEAKADPAVTAKVDRMIAHVESQRQL
ncbi:MAG TPA: type II toxin-antitoxin system CcdA family antitoxin [Nonomuraea sp.]|uniref:type II toxin-antitoxin system CcdA family antitoxin n=1 Tax=Nonomuraea sp. NPDC049649 TaxID=3155776 RepID=UPI002BC984D0|nr:type II toxin-antitoxin system CcdA family antitoxin [Nonomuraea sp.]